MRSLVSRRFTGDELQWLTTTQLWSYSSLTMRSWIYFARRRSCTSTSLFVLFQRCSTLQLFTVFVSYAEHTFHVCFALMTRKTAALYQAVLQKVHELVPQFQPTQVIADFQEAPLLPSVLCSGTMLQCKAVGFTLRERLLKVYAYWARRTHIRTTHIRMTVFRCLLSLPLLPVGDIICPHLTRSVLCWTTSCRLSH